MKINKVVIPAAGLGTRFLPFTKSIPKEMLPLSNKPAMHYIVKEAYDSGINTVFIITSHGKEALNNYFEDSVSLNTLLKERNKLDLISDLDNFIKNVSFNFIRQPEPLGLGHAILMAKEAINNEYFGIMLPDDIIISNKPCLNNLIDIAEREQASVILVQEVSRNKTSSYGIVGIKKQLTENLFEVSHLVEKPNPVDAPSNLAIVGRYVLSSKVMDSLCSIKPDSKNEIQLTDAIADMLLKGERILAYKLTDSRFDLGTPQGWIKAANYFIEKES